MQEIEYKFGRHIKVGSMWKLKQGGYTLQTLADTNEKLEEGELVLVIESRPTKHRELWYVKFLCRDMILYGNFILDNGIGFLASAERSI